MQRAYWCQQCTPADRSHCVVLESCRSSLELFTRQDFPIALQLPSRIPIFEIHEGGCPASLMSYS